MIPIDLCIDLNGAHAPDVIAAAVAAEAAGYAGLTLSDELCDINGTGTWSHEPWTLLSAIAARTSRIDLAPLVLNVANRDAGTTAVAAATLQQLSGGRLWLGLGAGTGRTSPFARDQLAFGRVPPRAPQRRAALEEHIATLHRVWSDDVNGFLTPEPRPAVIVGAFGPKTAELAGRVADGIAAPVDGFGSDGRTIEDQVATAHAAYERAGRSGRFRVIAHTGPHDRMHDEQWRTGSPVYERLAALGAERLVLFAPPSPAEIEKAAAYLPVPTSKE